MANVISLFRNLSLNNDSRSCQQYNKNDMMIWHTNINSITNNDFEEYIKTITSSEQQKVMKFHFAADRKRALISILLQRAMISDRFSIEDFEYDILRTIENKPYVKIRGKSPGTWNFNVSHHGDYVCIASHSSHLVGIDLVDTETRSPSMSSSAMGFIDMFRAQLTKEEYTVINSLPNDTDKYTHFFIIWSLKESYIKAIGLGLGFDLADIGFEVNIESLNNLCVNSCMKGSAKATIKGVRRDDWRFEFWGLDSRHIMTLARGPVTDSIPSYITATGWSQSSIRDSAEIHEKILNNSTPIISVLKSVKELVHVQPNMNSATYSPTGVMSRFDANKADENTTTVQEQQSSQQGCEEHKCGISPVVLFVDEVSATYHRRHCTTE